MIRELQARIGRALAAPPRTVAVAESCTGGGVCAALTAIPGASAYFLGGVVAYSNASKTRDLGVPEALIAARGAVSGEVADSMARGVRERFGADIGLGVTGIAGPGGGTPDKPAGTVFVALRAPGVRIAHRFLIPGDRESVRRETVVRALEALVAVAEDRGHGAGVRREPGEGGS